jgi:hypothetical protein
MIGSATTATYAQPLENGCALSRCQPQAQPAQPRPYRECGEGCAPPALSLRRLGAPTLRARLPSASTSSSRPNRTDEHGTDCSTDQLRGDGCSSSFHSTVDIRFAGPAPCSALASYRDQQSASLLADGAIRIDLTHVSAINAARPQHWERHGKMALLSAPSIRPRNLHCWRYLAWDLLAFFQNDPGTPTFPGRPIIDLPPPYAAGKSQLFASFR